MSLPLLILRPMPGALATLERAAALGLDAQTMPLFQIRALDWVAPDPRDFDAVLVTSANAIREGGAQLGLYQSLPLFAVGDASALAAREAGFAPVTAGSDDGAALVKTAVAAGYRRLLHLCGHVHKALATDGADITSVAVYSADAIDPAPALPISAPMVALAHSPRAAARLAAIAPDRSMIHLVTISEAAAAAAGTGWRSLQAAPLPTEGAMLAIAADLCQQGG